MISQSDVKYPFVIINTDQSDKNVRIGRISLIFTRKNKSLCLTVLVSKVLRISFQDDQKIINRVFYGAEKFDKKGNKMTLVTVRFSILEYNKIQKL